MRRRQTGVRAGTSANQNGGVGCLQRLLPSSAEKRQKDPIAVHFIQKNALGSINAQVAICHCSVQPINTTAVRAGRASGMHCPMHSKPDSIFDSFCPAPNITANAVAAIKAIASTTAQNQQAIVIATTALLSFFNQNTDYSNGIVYYSLF